MPQSTLAVPYREIYTADRQIPAEAQGYGMYDLSWNNEIDLDIMDYQAGDIQLHYQLSITLTNVNQSYIGQVMENPKRRLLGSYVFQREGFVEAESKRPLEYEKTRIIWNSEIYRLSLNQASRPKTLQLGAKPIIEMWPNQAVSIETYGQVEPIPLTGRSVGSEEGWGGPITENGDLKYVWSTSPDAEIAITKRFPVIPTAPLESILNKEELRFVVDKAEILFNEKLGIYNNARDLGILKMTKERNVISFTLYQGVGANLTFKIFQCGLYRNHVDLPVYPVPPPGGGGGGGGNAA